MLALSLFAPLFKPLTGIRELMLLPDVILYALALRCLLRGPRRTLTSPALFAILCFGVFYLIATLQIFNPNVPSLTAGLEGFRKTAWTSVAFFLAVMSMRTRSDVDRQEAHIHKTDQHCICECLHFGIPILIIHESLSIDQWCVVLGFGNGFHPFLCFD